jgi:uncharacterized membrane protein YqjE
VRLLWLLPKAAPALFRHLAAYAELAALDLGRSGREFKAQLAASIFVAVSGLFALLMACLLVVAFTWDTPYRIQAIAWMLGGFVAICIIGMLVRSGKVRASTPPFAELKQQWAEDRVIFEHMLATQHEEHRP